MSLPPEVREILALLVTGIREALIGNIVGVYLRGSLVTGDFDPVTSDVDFFAVTERPVSEDEFARLSLLHKRLAEHQNRLGDQLEGAYIPLSSARRFRKGEQHPTVYRAENFGWREHKENWLLERQTVREHGIALVGPDPRSLIDPISPDEIRAAVRSVLEEWTRWVADGDDPDWLLPLSHKAYVVETMCRALYTLEHRQLCGKPQAVAWALKTIPEPWRSTVERSREWRTDSTRDQNVTHEVMRFVDWVAAAGDTAIADYD